VQLGLERLEDRDLLAIFLWPGDNVNISRLNDNQAEATIAIDPTNTRNLFAASVTFHGSAEGAFDQNINVFV
jgi:thiamine biosynthesis lipoprotein ApbE